MLQVDRLERPLRAMAESAVRGSVSESSLEAIVGAGRGDLERAIAARLRGLVEAASIGVRIERVGLEEARPPRIVLDAYRDLARAASEREAKGNLGHSYRETTATAARAEASARGIAAAAARSGSIEAARGKADAFAALVAARQAEPELSDHRVYWQRVARAMSGRGKLILERAGDESRQHLLMPGGAGAEADALWKAAAAAGSLP
jgi:regulator of protease activity HflC (stomatin/prohibitin superfamily)